MASLSGVYCYTCALFRTAGLYLYFCNGPAGFCLLVYVFCFLFGVIKFPSNKFVSFVKNLIWFVLLEGNCMVT